MEKKLSNDIFRGFIITSILSSDFGDTQVDEGTYYYFVAKKLCMMSELESDLTLAFCNGVKTVAFLDTFKFLNAKIQENSINYEEKKLYDLIASISNFDDLENAIFSDTYLLEELIKYSVEFYRSNELRKILMVKKLTDAQKYSLKCSFNLFENDLEEYDFKEKMPIELFLNYYKEEMQKAENCLGVIDINAVYADVIEEIIGFIKMLAGNDYDTFEQIMKDIILLDYKWSKYILDNNLIIDSINIEENKDRLELFERNSIDTIIHEEVLYDNYYLNSLVESLIIIKGENLYIDENIINDKIVNDYYEKIKPRRLNKKINKCDKMNK